jgi:hypothetical protein
MLAGEPLPIHSGRCSREIIQILWPASKRSSIVHAVRKIAPISMRVAFGDCR